MSLSKQIQQLEEIIAVSNFIESDILAPADPASFDVPGSPRWPV